MLTFQQAALDEMRAAALWYEERAPGVGLRFLEAVFATAQRVAENPRLGALWKSRHLARKEIRRLPLVTFPYLLVYQRREDRIVIVAVAHTSRRPGYWFTRGK